VVEEAYVIDMQEKRKLVLYIKHDCCGYLFSNVCS